MLFARIWYTNYIKITRNCIFDIVNFFEIANILVPTPLPLWNTK